MFTTACLAMLDGGLTPLIIAAIAIAVVCFIILFFSFIPLGLWISAAASGVRVGLFTLIGMKIRKVRPARIINPLIKATKAGLSLSINKMEAHYLAGGNVDRVANALIAAQRAGIPLDFEKACAISGYMLGVNPFNQPGVESYKKNMFALLGKPGYEDQKAALEAKLG